ncbi:14442_t:CDS:2, partial [Dentiscutata erythropus]
MIEEMIEEIITEKMITEEMTIEEMNIEDLVLTPIIMIIEELASALPHLIVETLTTLIITVLHLQPPQFLLLTSSNTLCNMLS